MMNQFDTKTPCTISMRILCATKDCRGMPVLFNKEHEIEGLKKKMIIHKYTKNIIIDNTRAK